MAGTSLPLLARPKTLISLVLVLLMVAPASIIGAVSAQEAPAPVEPTISELPDAEREAFVDLYLDVFVRGVVPLNDTPGVYPDYTGELQQELADEVLEGMRADPTFAPNLDPVNAGPALGFSTPEDPLIDRETGEPVTQDRVDDLYRAFLLGLVFNREVFIDNIQAVAEDTMSPEDAEAPPADPAGTSEQENPIRREFYEEPLKHWGNTDPNATQPPSFEGLGPVLLEQPGIPEGVTYSTNVDVPAALRDLTPAQGPATLPMAMPTDLVQTVEPPQLTDPELLAEPSDLAAALPTSPLGAVPVDAWDDPNFQLRLPPLLEFLRDLANLATHELFELMGILVDDAAIPAKISGNLQQVAPEVYEHILDLDVTAAEFAGKLESLLRPATIVADTNALPEDLEALVASLLERANELQYAGTVNGVDFEGTWGIPEAIDIDSDGLADLLVQLTLSPAVVPIEDGLLEMRPHLIVERTNGVWALDALDDLPALPGAPFPVPMPASTQLAGAPLTGEQLLVAGVATSVPAPLQPFLPSGSAFPYDMTVAFPLADTDAVAVFDAHFPGGADHFEAILEDLGPSVQIATTGSPGAFEFLASILHEGAPGGDTSTLSLAGDQAPELLGAAAAINAAAGTSMLDLTPLLPMDLEVGLLRDGPAGRLALAASSQEMPPTTIVNEGADLAIETVEGANLAIARQDFLSDDTFDHAGLVLGNAAAQIDATLTEAGFDIGLDERGADVHAIAGLVDDGDYEHATWAFIENAGYGIAIDTSAGGLTFDSDSHVDDLRAVRAKTAAAALMGTVSGFKVTDELTAFGMPGAQEASVVPQDGGFDIQSLTDRDVPFLLDIEQTTARGLEAERFSFSNLPGSLAVDVRDGSINVGGNSPIDLVTGQLSRPLDGAGMDPTKGFVVLDDLNGQASVAMDEANVNVQASGDLASGNVLASNVIDGVGDPQFIAIPGNHMLADVVGTARQYSAQVTGMASLGEGLGGLISGLAGGLGGIALELALDGPLCWSFGKDGNKLEMCVSNVPDRLEIDLNLVPNPSLTYSASEEIDEITINLQAPQVDILFFVHGLPETVTMEFTRAGMDLIMSDRIDAIGMIAELADTTITAIAESIPSELHFGWDNGGMDPGIPAGDAIGRVYAAVSRPGFSFFVDIEHLPPVQFAWSDGSLDLDMSGDKIGSIEMQLLLNPAGNPAGRLQLLALAEEIPGVHANWDPLGGEFGTDGSLGGITLKIVLGPTAAPSLTMIFEILDVPQIDGASWEDGRFDLPLVGGRIGSVTFQFIAGDMDLFLQALGVPGLSAQWDDAGGSLSSDGPLDKITAYFAKGTSAPSMSIFFEIEDVPQLNGITWGDGIDMDFSGGRIGRIAFQFVSDQLFDSDDIVFFLEALGLPGFNIDMNAKTVSTTGVLDSLLIFLRRGPALDPTLFASLELEGVPAINAGAWDEGLGLGFSPVDARIDRINFLFLSNPAGTASDLLLDVTALGLPGISLDTTTGTISTTNVLDLISLDFRLGDLLDPTLLMLFELEGVPKIVAGLYGEDEFSLGFSPASDTIDRLELLFQVRTPSTPIENELQIHLLAHGLPGIVLGFEDRAGTIGTSATLDDLLLHFHFGPRGTPLIETNLLLDTVPQITAGGWTDGSFDLDLAGRIDQILLEFILNPDGLDAVPTDANDLYLILNAEGVPGIDVGFVNGGGTIGTDDTLDLIDLRAILGPRSGLTLTGEGLSLQLTIEGVPAVTGSWDDEGFDLGLAGRIDEILLEFIVDQAGSATDLFLRAFAQGIPGIDLGFTDGGGTIGTTGTLDLLDVRAILGARSGLNLAGTGLFARLTATSVPMITAGAWDDASMNLDLSGKIGGLTLEFFVNEALNANDIYLLLDASGIPTLSFAKSDTGFGLETPDGLDYVSLIFRKGVFNYDPHAYGPTFVGAWIRPDGVGTSWPGNPQFAVSAKVSGIKEVVWSTNDATESQSLDLEFTGLRDIRAIVDLETAAFLAEADLSLTNLPADVSLDITPDVVGFASANGCVGFSCLAKTPWLQGKVNVGTRGAANAMPEPFWPWQTVSEPGSLCPRNAGFGTYNSPCGIMGNTFIDVQDGGFASKWKLDLPLPDAISFTKSAGDGVPTYSLNTGSVKVGKLDIRVNTELPLPIYPHELNLMAVATVSNLPTSLSVVQGMGNAAEGGKPTINVNTGQPIDKIFVGLRLDGSWYHDPGLITVSNSNINDNGFPIWLMVEDVPTTVSLSTGKSSYQTSNCQSCNPPVPFINYNAASNTLDAMVYTNIGDLWGLISRAAIDLAGDVIPDWLEGLANYDSQGHLLIQAVDIPSDGIALFKSGNSFHVDASPILNQRLTKFFVDFQLKFSDGDGRPSSCIICLGIADLKYYWHYSWWFGIETLSLLLEDLGSVGIDPGIESIVNIDGRLVFHFRAGAGFDFGAGLEFYVAGIRFLCVCIESPTISLILDPGFISFEVLSWSCCQFDYFWIGSPFHGTGYYWAPRGHFCLCDWHWYAKLGGTYPGNWGFDLPIAIPPIVPFRGLDIAYGTHHVFMNPRLLLCAGGDWREPEVVCVSLGRLYPTEFIVVYAMLRYFSISISTGSEHHHH
ncbi:MAG: hypothetical protein ACPGQL_00970 [Thermoplasmatota archaeon]